MTVTLFGLLFLPYIYGLSGLFLDSDFTEVLHLHLSHILWVFWIYSSKQSNNWCWFTQWPIIFHSWRYSTSYY